VNGDDNTAPFFSMPMSRGLDGFDGIEGFVLEQEQNALRNCD
jgi:hypothetical protein